MPICEWCEIRIDRSCDEAHVLPNDDEETVCDACYNDWTVWRRPNPYFKRTEVHT